MALLVPFQIYWTACDWWHAIQLYNYSIQGFRVGFLSGCRLTTLSRHERWALTKKKKRSAAARKHIFKWKGWNVKKQSYLENEYWTTTLVNMVTTIIIALTASNWSSFFSSSKSVDFIFICFPFYSSFSLIFSKVIEFGANIYIVCNCDISDLKKQKKRAEEEKWDRFNARYKAINNNTC